MPNRDRPSVVRLGVADPRGVCKSCGRGGLTRSELGSKPCDRRMYGSEHGHVLRFKRVFLRACAERVCEANAGRCVEFQAARFQQPMCTIVSWTLRPVLLAVPAIFSWTRSYLNYVRVGAVSHLVIRRGQPTRPRLADRRGRRGR